MFICGCRIDVFFGYLIYIEVLEYIIYKLCRFKYLLFIFILFVVIIVDREGRNIG